MERFVLLLLAAFALVGFVVSPALGGPGFLTKQKANRLFLKKRAADRLFLSKRSAGALLSKADAGGLFYSRAEADSRFLRPEGEIRINAGPTNWVLGPTFEGTAPETTYFADALRLRSTTQTTAFPEIAPELPVTLYGRATKILGAELCYSANANAQLQSAFLEIVSESNGPGEPPPLTEVAKDQTTRTDNACRTYRASSPVPIGPNGHVLFGLAVHYPNNSISDFLIGRTTFVLQP